MQLEHDEEETTWEKHGFVAVCDADGNELVRSEDAQHNRKWSERIPTMQQMAADAASAA